MTEVQAFFEQETRLAELKPFEDEKKNQLTQKASQQPRSYTSYERLRLETDTKQYKGQKRKRGPFHIDVTSLQLRLSKWPKMEQTHPHRLEAFLAYHYDRSCSQMCHKSIH